VPITDAQKAFWKRVNTQGGIGGYDVDAETYVRDNKYNADAQRGVQEIKGKSWRWPVAGVADHGAILPDMKQNSILPPRAWRPATRSRTTSSIRRELLLESMNASIRQRHVQAKTVHGVHLAATTATTPPRREDRRKLG